MIRLTNKLQKQDYTGQPYPFCPLCLGPRDKINNLLEIGSTIKAIRRPDHSSATDAAAPEIESVQTADDWFRSSPDEVPIEKAFCFGCKRLCIETKPEKRAQFISLLPGFVKANAQRTLASDLQSAHE